MRRVVPGGKLIVTKVASPFLTPFKTTFFVALFIAMPYVLFQVWQFVAPGLYRREKRFAMPLLISSIVLFYVGIAFAYFVVFQVMFTFFAQGHADRRRDDARHRRVSGLRARDVPRVRARVRGADRDVDARLERARVAAGAHEGAAVHAARGVRRGGCCSRRTFFRRRCLRCRCTCCTKAACCSRDSCCPRRPVSSKNKPKPDARSSRRPLAARAAIDEPIAPPPPSISPSSSATRAASRRCSSPRSGALHLLRHARDPDPVHGRGDREGRPRPRRPHGATRSTASTASTYLLSLFGGWIADRLIGQQRAVLCGGMLIMVGNAMLAAGAAHACSSSGSR